MKHSGERIDRGKPLLFCNVSTAAVQKAFDYSRPPEIRYRTWSPPQSSIEIEYSDELLREVRLTSMLGDASGVLYGSRHGQCIRIVAARREVVRGGFERDPRLAGLELVGVFFVRLRGHVFLTESDLGRFECCEGPAALVVAGAKAGFFVYEADGSIETIKSQEEFLLPGAVPPTKLVEPPTFVIQDAKISSRIDSWVWIASLAFLSIAIAFLTQPYWLPRPQISLTAHELSGQLRISWNPAAAGSLGTTLEIADGNAHVSMPLSPAFASATYVRRTSDVQIHFTASGSTETIRFFGGELPPSQIDIARQRVSDLESEAQTLDAGLERGARRIARLQTAINSLIHASK